MQHLIILNKLKSFALGLDAFFKKQTQKSIKYHHAISAVYQSTLELMQAREINKLRDILGDAVDDHEAMALMQVVLSEFVEGFIAAGIDDQALSRVSNNFKILDKEGRFPLYIDPIPAISSFSGRVIITDSFDSKAQLEEGKLVNVTMTIDRKDAAALVEVVRAQLEAMGLVVGRLTGTDDTVERHVSFALRIPYTSALGEIVAKLNDEMPNFTFSTAAKLKIVTPPDIRTSQSALELLDNRSCEILHQWQVTLHEAAGQFGNKLPPLHITHGNSPIMPASTDEIAILRIHTSGTLDNVLSQYGLDLAAAFEMYQAQIVKNKTMEKNEMKKFDAAGLTYLNTETMKVGINPDIGLLDLIKMTHPEKYAQISDKKLFLEDIHAVNKLLQEIYLRDNELRWQSSGNIHEIDELVDNMPHLNALSEQISDEVDLMIFPGTTGVLMSSIAATAREFIKNGAKVKNIAVLASTQEWKQEWVRDVKTVFELRPDLLKKDIDLASVDFEKKYTEHDVNALISQLIDFGDNNIHFEYLPVQTRKLNDGRIVNPNSNDEANVFFEYYSKIKQEKGENPTTVLVSTKGFHVRQSYAYLQAAINDIKVLMSDPEILGNDCCEKFKNLVRPNTRAKLDNLAKTIYQTIQILKVIYPEMNFADNQFSSVVSGNRASFVNNLGNKMPDESKEDNRYNSVNIRL